jgi:hypothetical protein
MPMTQRNPRAGGAAGSGSACCPQQVPPWSPLQQEGVASCLWQQEGHALSASVSAWSRRGVVRQLLPSAGRSA